MSYKTDYMSKGVIWNFYNTMTADDLYESSTAVYGHPDFDGMRFQIVDMTQVQEVTIDEDSMEMITGMDLAASQTNPYIVVAVVGSDDKIKQLVDIYESVDNGAPWKTEVFSQRTEAIAWINSIYPECITP